MKLQILVYFNDQKEAFNDAVNHTTHLLKTASPIEFIGTGSDFTFAITCDATDIYFLSHVLRKFGEFTALDKIKSQPNARLY